MALWLTQCLTKSHWIQTNLYGWFSASHRLRL